MKLYTIKKYAAILLCLAAFTSCDTDAEGTKYGVNGVEAAFASTQMNVEVGAEDKWYYPGSHVSWKYRCRGFSRH